MVIYKNNSVIVDKIDDIYILLNTENNKIFDINQMGYMIWSCIIDSMEQEDLYTVIKENTEDIPQYFKKEIGEYMSLLEQEGIIKFSNEKSNIPISYIRANFIRKFIEEQGYYFLKYHGSSMASVFNKGQIILIEKFSQETAQIGDVVIFPSLRFPDLIIHRIYNIKIDENTEKTIITKGDDLDECDAIYLLEDFSGKAIVPQILKTEKPMLKEDVVIRDEDDNAIIYKYSTGEMKILNPVGNLIIKAINGERQLAEIVEILLEQIDEIPSVNTILKEAESFILDLKEKEYIIYE